MLTKVRVGHVIRCRPLWLVTTLAARIACRACGTIRHALAIELPLPKVVASIALLAHLVVSRFVDHHSGTASR